MNMVILLVRFAPLLLVLAVVAALAYLVMRGIRTPARAKEVLVIAFTWLFVAISVASAVVLAYALFEGNQGVIELAVGLLAVALVGLGVTRICGAVFRRRHPHYKDKPQRARVVRRWPWKR